MQTMSDVWIIIVQLRNITLDDYSSLSPSSGGRVGRSCWIDQYFAYGHRQTLQVRSLTRFFCWIRTLVIVEF